MRISNGLKKIRKILGLSQEKMAGHVLTKSYYSKIERGKFEIKASDLVEILSLHDIKASEFFSMLEKKERQSKYDYYIDILRKCYYKNDLMKIQKVINDLKTEKQDRKTKILLAHAVLLEANFENKIDKVPASQVKIIQKLIFEIENWDKYSLRLFSMAMNLFEVEELNIIVQTILDKYNQSENYEFQKFFSAILVNFLNYSFCFKNQNMKIVQQAIAQLEQVSAEPQNCFTLIMGKYYKSLLCNNYEKANEIINFLQQIGMHDFVEKMKKKCHE